MALFNVVLTCSIAPAVGVGNDNPHFYTIARNLPYDKALSKANALQMCKPENADAFRAMVEEVIASAVTIGDAEIAVSNANVQHIKKQEKVQLRYYKNIEGGKITPLGISKLQNAGFKVSKGGIK